VHFRSLDIAERLRWIERERLVLFQGRRLSRRFKLPEIAVGWLSDVDLEKIARVIITELEAQGVAERVVEKRVVPRFAIARSVLEELWKD
jgi:cobalamin biosynthesis protein CbiG